MSDNINEKDELVQVSKQELSSLMERISKLESGNTMVKAERPKYRTAKVWFLDEEKTEMVTGYGKNRNDKNSDGTETLMMEVFYQKGKDIKAKWVPHIEFRNGANYVVGKILSIKNDPKIITHGTTKLKNIDYEKYRTTETDIDVPLEVVVANDTYEIELPDGTKVELNANALN
jgi:hypothetical protein